MRKTLALLVLALAVPGAALAANVRSSSHGKVMYVLRGKLSSYTAASAKANGSITIHVTNANRHGRLLRGRNLTFVVTANTKVTASSGTKLGKGQIKNGTRGTVDFRAGARMSNRALIAALADHSFTAFKVIAQKR
jgi:hypothetical protein